MDRSNIVSVAFHLGRILSTIESSPTELPCTIDHETTVGVTRTCLGSNGISMVEGAFLIAGTVPRRTGLIGFRQVNHLSSRISSNEQALHEVQSKLGATSRQLEDAERRLGVMAVVEEELARVEREAQMSQEEARKQITALKASVPKTTGRNNFGEECGEMTRR